MVVIAANTALLVVGVRESARANSVIVAIKLVDHRGVHRRGRAVRKHGALGDGAQSGRAISFRRTSAPANSAVSGVVRGAAVVFFAYIGFDAVSTAAQEAKNPKRDMPIGILGSLVMCTVLYVAVGFVLTGIVPYDQLNVPDPIAVGIDAVGLAWLVAGHQARHHLRPDLGHSGHAARPAAHLLFDGARRLAAAGRGEGASAIPHALRHHDRHRSVVMVLAGAAADRPGRRTGQHRHAVRLRHRLRRRVGVAHHASPDLPRPFQDAGGLCRRAAGRGVFGVPDVRPAARHLAAVRRLAGDRALDLRVLRHQAQPRAGSIVARMTLAAPRDDESAGDVLAVAVL